MAAPPIIRDVTLRLSRSGAAGNDQVPLQEAHVELWTGRSGGARGNSSVVAEYGETAAYGQTTAPTPAGPFHRVYLGDLTPGRGYHFRLVATGAAGSPDAGQVATSQDFAFTATPGAVPPGPTLIHQPVTGTTATGATINWTTNPACPNGQVNYSLSPSLDPLAVGSESGTGERTAHAVTLAGLTPSTRYYYRIFQVAPAGSSTLSSLRSFVTTA